MRRKVFNSKRTRHHRRRLRNDSSPVEAILWSRLKGRAVGGYKFRRQHSVGGFIVDFYCPKARLAIEVDGAQHFESAESIARDRERQHAIEAYGIRFIRFTGKDVWQHINQVTNHILLALTDLHTTPLIPLLGEEGKHHHMQSPVA
ncbi:MAG: endonuclease domain-containing protein [Patescibacteria group bacterium]